MLVDKQSELMSDLLFTVHQHGGDDVMWKPLINESEDKSVLPSTKENEENSRLSKCSQQIVQDFSKENEQLFGK